MKRFCLFAVIALITIAVQAEPTFVVSDIKMIGLRRTQPWVVSRELQFETGDTISTCELSDAERRLRNLIIFNSVNATADSSGVVTVDVREAWPIVPYASVTFKEGSFSEVAKRPRTLFDKATLYAGAGHLNFRGNGDLLLGYGQFGASEGFALEYRSRWLSSKLPFSADVVFSNLRVSDREWVLRDSSAYMRDIYGLMSVATHAGAPTRIGTSLIYRGIRKEALKPGEERTTRTAWISPYVILDRRNLEWYPTRGAFARVTTDFAAGDIQFIRSQYDLRAFVPLLTSPHSWIIATRFYAATSTSSTPAWAAYYWGFASALRGYSGEQRRASTFLVGDAELRFPIIPETAYDVPYLGSYGERWPFGINGVIFFERAELQLDGKRAERFGTGAGLYVRVPYVQILEAVITLNGDHELVYDLSTGVRF